MKILWQIKVDDHFNTVSYGNVFKDKDKSIITGGCDGIVRIYSITKESNQNYNIQVLRILESKGGPIFHICVHDVTRLLSNDIIIADSLGTVTMFCNGKIFLRKSSDVHTNIPSMQVFETATGNINILTGSDDGIIQSFNAFNELWKIRLCDINCNKTPKNILSVTAILATSIGCSTASGIFMDYIVVADSNCNLHFVREGNVLLSISTPGKVDSIVAGYFLPYENDEGVVDYQITQLALGCDDGFVWICADFEIQDAHYADIGHPVTKLHKVSKTHSKSLSPNNAHKPYTSETGSAVDLLLCAGHYSMIYLLKQGKIISKLEVSDWVISICELSTEDDDKASEKFLIGCLDSTLYALQVT